MKNFLYTYLWRHEAGMVFLAIALVILWPQMLENFTNSNYMPHGHCYMWLPNLVWLHVISDLLIGLAYVAISLTLGILIIKARKDIPFHGMFLAFGVFIISCGFTHFMAVWTLWEAVYWISGAVKLVTAAASVVTAVALPFVIPRVLDMVRSAKLSDERKLMLESANEKLEALNEKLHRMDQLKTTFFTNVSHELRTPLTLILGPSEKLSKEKQIPQECKKEIQMIRNNAVSMLNYVNDLLDVSKLEVGKLKPVYAETDISHLLKSTVSNFDSLARKKKINLNVEAPDSIMAEVDPEKITRVLLNLLSNAFKYSPEDGYIKCRVKRKGNYAVFEIEDNGQGIDVKLREKIFERFSRVEDYEYSRVAGTGLGLSIAKEFVEMHGGKIKAEESPSGGALFIITIPLNAAGGAEITRKWNAEYNFPKMDYSIEEAVNDISPPSEERDRKQEVKTISGKAPLLVIVEDNPDMNDYIVNSIGDKFNILNAYNGEEGFRLIKEKIPDLVISDIMMPKMTGDKMVKKMREDIELSHIPVIFLTARADDELKIELLKLSSIDYLNKPFIAEELLARVNNLIEMKKARDILQMELESKGNDMVDLITALMEKKNEIKESLEEKRLLLKEVHHRVKNNLQVISSLINLQLNHIEDKKSLSQFNDLRARIRTMSLVHEKLNRPSDITYLKFKDYLNDLVSFLRNTYSAGNEKPGFKIDMEEMEVNIDSAITLGLLINEIAVNSLKHAFASGIKGEIKISIKTINEENIEIIVADNGKGLPENFDWQSSSHLGFLLIDSFASQLNGEVELLKEKGTAFRIIIPKKAML